MPPNAGDNFQTSLGSLQLRIRRLAPVKLKRFPECGYTTMLAAVGSWPPRFDTRISVFVDFQLPVGLAGCLIW